jgi:hypothetical protein
MAEPRFKKRSGTDAVYLPGVGKLRDGQVVAGEQYARYCPQFLERTSDPVSPGKASKKAAKKPTPPPPPIEPVATVELPLDAPPVASEPAPPPADEPSTTKRRRRRKREDDE